MRFLIQFILLRLILPLFIVDILYQSNTGGMAAVFTEPDPKLTQAVNYRNNLLANLMRGYNRKRPSQTPLQLYTYLFIEHMKEFNEYDMTMQMQATLVLNWLDSRLRWDPEDNGHLNSMQITDYKIMRFWLPQIQVKAIMPSKRTVIQPTNTELLITQYGQVFSASKINTPVTCDTQIQDYPFDRPNCSLYILCRNYEGENLEYKVVFGNVHSITDHSAFFHGGNVSQIKEIRITNFTSERYYVTSAGLKIQASDDPIYKSPSTGKPIKTLGSFVHYQIFFERNVLTYTSNVILPLYMGTLLTLTASATDNQKYALMLFLLTIFFQYLSITRISFNLPPNYTATPFCIKYAGMIFAETIILFVYKLLVAYLTQSYERDPKMMLNLAFAQRYFRYFLAIQLFVCTVILFVL